MRAAVEVATACGIQVTEPSLLQETNNTVVWLRPSPVVAKVATRPASKVGVRREHAVASELATLGAEIAVPLPGLESVEHLSTGFVVTLWERLKRVSADVADRALADSLAALHAALAETRTKLPSSGGADAGTSRPRRRHVHGRARDGRSDLPAYCLTPG